MEFWVVQELGGILWETESKHLKSLLKPFQFSIAKVLSLDEATQEFLSFR